MARLKKHNGYYIKTLTFNDKRYYIYGKSLEDLNIKYLNKRKELEEGKENFYNPRLKDYYNYFSDLRREEVKESTLRAQKYQFNNMSLLDMGAGVTFGDMRIKDITRKDVEHARQVMLSQGKKPEHINICFAHLNHVFNCAVNDDTIIKNPCKSLKPLKRRSDPISENKHRALTETETVNFFECANNRNSYYMNILQFMLLTGVRVGELGAIYLTDIDIKSGFIHIRRSITREESGNYIVGEDTKTYSGKRDIPLTPAIMETINKQKELNNMLFGLSWSGVLFKSSQGDLLREYTVNREIQRICKQAEIEKFTCHALRVTFATRFIEQRPQDYKILSEIMGHKDISITLNLYTRVMTENKIKAMNDLQIKTS